jgi:hypothetical protein
MALPKKIFIWKLGINLICWIFGALILGLFHFALGTFLTLKNSQILATAANQFDWSELVDARAYLTVFVGALASLSIVFLILLKLSKRNLDNPDGIKRTYLLADIFANEISSLNLNFGSMFFLAVIFSTKPWVELILYIFLCPFCYLVAWLCNQDETELNLD